MRVVFVLMALFMPLRAATAVPGSDLGGYRLSSSAAGLELLYNNGSEVDLTIPSATTDAGTGTGHALAAPLYPGAVGGNPGATLKQFLGSHLPPQLADTLGTLTYPLKAEAYASGPTDSSFPAGGPPQALTDIAHADADGGHMTASGTFVTVGGLDSSATSVTQVAASTVTTTATSSVTDLSVAGLIHIGHVGSTATASSDGATGRATGSTTIAALTVAGMSVAINPTDLSVGVAHVPVNLGALLNPVLKALGIELTISPEHRSATGAKAAELAPALTISFNPPNSPGNSFLLTLGGAEAHAQATAPFGAGGQQPAFSAPLPSSTVSLAPVASAAPVATPPAAVVSSPTPVPEAQPATEPILSVPAVLKDTPIAAGLVAFGLALAASAAWGLGKVRDDVLAEPPAGRGCPLEQHERVE